MSQNEIHQIDCTENTDYKTEIEIKTKTETKTETETETENVLTMTSDNQPKGKCFQAFKKILVLLDTFFKIPRIYTLSHINDDTDTISRADSERRLCLLFWCLGLFLNFGLAILIGILFYLHQNQIVPITSDVEEMSSNIPVVQKLAVIFGDGTTLFFALNKSLELIILKTHKFNYDNCGFFAYDGPNHIQTLVGSSGKLNYIHDSNFNSKKIQGIFSLF